MSESEKTQCEICNGPHQTSAHFDWVEKPEEMQPKDILVEIHQYAEVLDGMQSGGMAAAEKVLKKMGMTMYGDSCFCGTPNHTGADHLRWLLDKKSELQE